MNKDRVPELDLLRFLAALAVVIYHFGHVDVGQFSRIAQFGFLGVQLFFMISGFVILWTAMKKNAVEFVISRISRLYPTFWVCVALTTLTLAVIGHPVGLVRLLANLSMIPGPLHQTPVDDVYWTLVIEIKFYAVILGLILIRQLSHIRRFLCSWLCVSVLAVFYPKLHAFAFDSLSVYFIAGCYLYLIRTKRVLIDLLPLTVCAILSVHNSIGGQFTFTHNPQAGMWVGVIVVAEYALFLSVALRTWALPKHALWGWLGAMTYPLYLVHSGTVDNLGLIYLPEGPARFWILLAASLLLAFGLAALIERHGCAAVNRWLLGSWIRAFHQRIECIHRGKRAGKIDSRVRSL